MTTNSYESRFNKALKNINFLYTESNNLFSEVLDSDITLTYRMENLLIRAVELSKIYQDLSDELDDLYQIEIKNYQYAAQKFQLKILLSMMTTLTAFFANGFLGVLSFVLLTKKASNDYTADLKDVEESESKFTFEKLEQIRNILSNSSRILNGKIEKSDSLEAQKDAYLLLSNSFFSAYIEGRIDEEALKCIPSKCIDIILPTLQKNYCSTSNDFIELSKIAKKRTIESEEKIKHIKK